MQISEAGLRLIEAVNAISDQIWAVFLVMRGCALLWTGQRQGGLMLVGAGLAVLESGPRYEGCLQPYCG